MVTESLWRPDPLPVPPRLSGFLTETGSLTARLLATGEPFAVNLLPRENDLALPDELELFGLSTPTALNVRHVALTLAGVPVVVARSLSRPACPVWSPILDRGRRSLGLTLFSGDMPVVREPLRYRRLEEDHWLFGLARRHDEASAGHYPARRSRFLLDGEILTVCEVFLPALERFAR
ncbi:chorismate--pyruvate lyase family protein [Paludibacterium paludis]|nr:chorismate lyase [Paludibacterium paludis]